ncbi:MAG: hypothetical protein BWY77_00459 [bacterium ADurb.Bin431]|nr:MAG: hypothetical protein BWY77_00459 [bacterium ADurb.Bin431]
MAEEGAKTDEFLAVIGGPDIGGAPGLPDPVGQGMGGGTKTEDVEDHRLHVAGPGGGIETLLGMPAHRHGFASVHEPVPVRREIERVGQGADLRFDGVGLVEIALAEEGAHDEQGGVHIRELAVPFALTARDLQKVVVKSLVAGGCFGLRMGGESAEEAQGLDGALRRLAAGEHAVLDGKGKGGEGVSRCGDAAGPG